MPAATKSTPKNPPRRDPRPRHLDGSAVWAHLIDPDPDKHYVFVNKGDPDAMSHYDFAGYEVEHLTPGGVRPAGGRTGKMGDPIEVRGLLLHSISKEKHAQIVMYGVDGNSGQAGADEIEAAILDRRGADPLRGLHARGLFQVVNETQPTKIEVATP